MARSAKKKKRNSKEKTRERRGFRFLFYWGTVLSLWAVILCVAVATYVVVTATHSDNVNLPERTAGVTVLAANGEVLAFRGAFLGDRVRLDEMPDHLPQSVIATEDRRFYYHFGVDPIGLARAMIANYRAGRISQGGSTISQQLAKNLFLKPERTLRRKIHEMILAIWLEIKYDKREILQLYMNRVYFGAGAYGVDAAAVRYFGKSARDVTLAESAMLAGLLKAPTRYAPTRDLKRARKRANLVLAGMAEAGYITAKQAVNAADKPTKLAGRARLPAIHYVVDWINELLPSFTGIKGTDLVVETTIDPHLQRIADAAVARHMETEGRKAGVGQAAAVILEPTGAVKAMVGGRSYARSQFNRAVKARRQPGSAFKPFVYLAALERGLTPDSRFADRRVRFGNWSPRNFNNRYYGRMTLRQALARSSNAIAATLAYRIGPREIARTARRMGIATKLKGNASIALGTSEVTPLELTAAYVPFANGGYGVLPFIIHRIRTREGDILYRRSGSGPGLVVTPQALAGMNSMMKTVITHGTGRAARLSRHPAAGKTGTSQEYRDAWFIGYTSSLVAGVWVGNDDQKKKIRRVTGGGLPARIWRDIMEPAHARLPAEDLPGAGRNRVMPNPIERLLSSLQAGAGEEPPRNGDSFWDRLFGTGGKARDGL